MPDPETQETPIDPQETVPVGRTVTEQPYALTKSGKGKFLSKNKSIAERLWERIQVKQPWECWPWTGSTTSGAGRTPVRYGNVNEGSLDGGDWKRNWRAHVAVLILFRMEETLQAVPMDEGEDLIPWMRRARRYFVETLGLQASHQCDNSLCCNPTHLEWESQSDNLAFQRYREKRRETEPGWVPRCCQPPEQANRGGGTTATGEPGGSA